MRRIARPENVRYFEACLPIEEIARRGRDTLRFGPMKPMGLIDPRTGRRPWAVVQLRQEDARAGSYNLVGFQNHMRFGDQERVLRMIPGLERAEFLRFGQVHRNTYINGPALLAPTLQMRTRPDVFFAGQISGVEGYVESIATGLIAGRGAAALAMGDAPRAVPARNRHGIARGLRVGSRSPALPACEYHLRSYCPSWKIRRAIRKSATPRSAAARWPRSKNTCAPMSELALRSSAIWAN